MVHKVTSRFRKINITCNTHAHASTHAYTRLYASVDLLIVLKFYIHVRLLNIASEIPKCLYRPLYRNSIFAIAK